MLLKMVKQVLICGLATLVVCTVCDVYGTITSSVRKCCLQDEILIYSKEGYECSKVVDSHNISVTDVLWWLPRSAMNEEVENELINNAGSLSYGSQPNCDFGSRDFLHYMDSGDVKEFSFHVRDSEIRLDVSKEASFHDLDRGREDSFSTSTFCVDMEPDNDHIVILCPCTTITCVRKCCYDGQFFDTREGRCEDLEDGTLITNDENFFDWIPKVDKYEDYYRLEGRLPSCDKFTQHTLTTRSNDSQLLLREDGSIKALDTEEIFPKDQYCGIHNEGSTEIVILCLKVDKTIHTIVKKVAYGLLFVLGAMCLLVTVLVTVILPEMRRNIQGKIALAHNVMLFITYFASSISHFHGQYAAQSFCAGLTLVIQYSLLAAFFWLNIMCIDITCGCYSKSFASRDDRMKFVFYSLYAWGTPSVISAATILAEYSPIITSLKPTIGTKTCFFNNRGAELLFFYGPMALLLATNLVLFILTVKKISSDKLRAGCVERSETLTTKKNKHKLVLFVKLFCIMGITWVTEVISWAVGGPNYYWYLTDVINLLRAVFIFYFFCCKRSIYLKLRYKIFKFFGKDLPPLSSKDYTNSTTMRQSAISNTPEPDRKLEFQSLTPKEEVTLKAKDKVEEFEMI